VAETVETAPVGELDLEGRLHHHAITLVGADTGGLRTGYEWRPVGDELAPEWERGTFEGDRFEVWTPAEAIAVHLGRTTHVWDAPVLHVESGKTIALFRCTQMILRRG